MCRPNYHSPNEEFTNEELQSVWHRHVYEEQLSMGTIKDRQSSFDNVIADDDNSSVSLTKEVC